MSDQPQSAEAELALYVGSAIAGSLVGGLADELITSPVLSFVGIGKSDDTAARYLEKISKQLTALGESLDDQMRGLQDSLSEIKGISSQIQDYLTHEGLAQALRSYNDSATTIQTIFELFVDDVSALSDVVGSSTTAGSSQDPASDLYTNVLNSANADRVSEAMSRIRDLVVKPSDFDKGILDYLMDMVKGEIQTFAQTDNNLVHQFTRDRDQNYPTLTKSIQLYDSYKIVVNGYEIARAEPPKIAALFKSIVSTQLRGLILLSKAWQESPHAPTLGVRTREVLEGIKLMKAFYAQYKTTVDTTITNSLKANGKYLPDDYVHKVQLGRDLHPRSNVKDPGGFMNHDWIMMRIEEATFEERHMWGQPKPDRLVPQVIVWMVYQPWNDASQLPAGADRYCEAFAEDGVGVGGANIFGGWTMPPNFPDSSFGEDRGIGEDFIQNAAKWDGWIWPGLKKLPDAQPAELAAVLNGLPSSEEMAMRNNLSVLHLLTESTSRGIALSFKCEIDGQSAVWLQGNPTTGSLSLATKRDRTGATSTAWRVFFTHMPPDQLKDTAIKCLGFAFGKPIYLNGKSDAMQIELAASADPEVSGGTQWVIRLWEDNVVSFVRVIPEEEGRVLADRGWVAGNPDGSVSLTNYRETPGLKWTVHPYVIDTA